MKTATITLYHDKRRGDNTLKLYATFERKQRLYTTGHKVDAKTFERLKANAFKDKPDGKIKDSEFTELWYNLFSRDTSKPGQAVFAQDIATKLGPNFTFDTFKEAFDRFGKEPEKAPEDQTNAIAALYSMATRMENAERIGNANSYISAARSLQRFIDSFSSQERKEFLQMPITKKLIQQPPVLRFEHITPHFLTTYEQWMLTHGKAPQSEKKEATGASTTTIGIYLRQLRAVVNEAIENGFMNRDTYPFTRNRYVIPAGANTKKALDKADLEKIKSYQPEPDTFEQRSHDLFLFSYFGNGINMSDICRLTWGQVDLKGGKITFIRKKTARSRKQNQITISVQLRPETVAIIERCGTIDRSPSNYVFPYLSAEMTERQKVNTVHQVIKVTNKWMARIAEKLGIEAEVNSYAARHSFATTLLKSEAPLALIAKLLGHSNMKTTENYLGSFDDEETKKYLDTL